MRMHRKSHLDERLEACGDILTVADLADKNMKNAAAQRDELDYGRIFGNGNPVRLEIGCGKGKFICELAARTPDINFIAVEKISNVLIEAVERARAEGLRNVHFINSAAEVLPRYIRERTVEVVYLNFSNPLPKLGYAKQRLTHPRFLEEYKLLLKEGGRIIQKTDDKDFYAFSLESYERCGYEILEKCEDLHALADPENIVTEHEKRFSEMGKNIYRIIAKI
ncbi:MAG: tRNA (guanosine(46)-N7)-methyltransferase TrmB [Clostridia bacterium]|nr:tRNA (guanosine(46)-N7)-methyltransferase TrmB [Clostridia bacterium]